MPEPRPRVMPVTLAQAMARAQRLPVGAAVLEVMLATAAVTLVELAAMMEETARR